jgi:hypothetical protein
MRDVLVLFVHLIVTIVRLMRPGGVRSVLAECVLLRHQLQVLNRPRQRAPDLHPIDRFIAGLCGGLMRPARLLRSAIVLKPATILKFHRSLVKRKYRELFSPKRKRARPGPKGPSPELGAAIVAMKRRNPRFGYQRIADQLSVAFGITLDKDTVRRVLAKHYRPSPDSGGPSWLSFLSHSRDSLYSTDLFRCESLILNTHWVMVVMDQYTRRIIGFAVHKGTLDGPAVCRMFGRIISGTPPPIYLSSDNDPLFEFHQWKTNLRSEERSDDRRTQYEAAQLPFNPQYRRDQDRSLRTHVTPIRGTANRHDPARVSRSRAVLECKRSGKETVLFPRLLQSRTCSSRTRRQCSRVDARR